MDYKELLRSNNLSLTSHRLALLGILSGCNQAVSEKEIETRMQTSCNRTTIYRNLNSLVEKNIVHRILSADSVKYKLIHTSAGKKSSDHVHFDCRQCNKTFCLEDLDIQDFKLPDGFTKLENQFIIIGICKNCRYEMG